MEVPPRFEFKYWICPKCGKKNPYPRTMVLTYPPKVCYRCECGYHYDKTLDCEFDVFVKMKPKLNTISHKLTELSLILDGLKYQYNINEEDMSVIYKLLDDIEVLINEKKEDK